MMASKTLFNNVSKTKYPKADMVNAAGGLAYDAGAEHDLCQYAVTGCFNGTFYSNADEQLDTVKGLVAKCDSEVIAKVAVYSREVGNMKDMPAFLLAVLASRGELELVRKIFDRVVNNSKMLCNFVQIIRSGQTGRSSFGSALKKLINKWLTSRTGEQLYFDSVGHANPSLGDILKMVHTKPETKVQNSVFGYILDKDFDYGNLPDKVKQLERFKKDNSNELPDVPFRLLTNYNLTPEHWKKIAKDMKWNTLRMNLNMLNRNGVFTDAKLTKELVEKLRDREEVRKNNVFPYQLLTAYQNTNDVPTSVKNALQDALEHATENVPSFGGKVAVCVDTSGSMSCAITGNRGSVTSVTTCVDVAGLIAACVVRKNDESVVVPFDDRVHTVQFNARDSVMTNAQKFARNGGGTDCSCALADLNRKNWKGDLVIYVSDNMSWMSYNGGNYYSGTGMNAEWQKFKARNKGAKLVMIDLVPNQGLQVKQSKDVLAIGGWSDSAFTAIANFAEGSGKSFVDVVKEVKI
jgi:60 kDa SS-A/Ro ribonucleoprotein